MVVEKEQVAKSNKIARLKNANFQVKHSVGQKWRLRPIAVGWCAPCSL